MCSVGQGREGQGQMGRMVESWMVDGGWWMVENGDRSVSIRVSLVINRRCY